MSTILVATEIQEGKLKSINYEIFTAATQLAEHTHQTVTALFLGSGLRELAVEAGNYGIANAIIVEDDKLTKFSPDCFAAAVAEVARQKDAGMVLMGATYTGKDIMARVSQILDAGLAQDCISYRFNGDKISFIRPIYAGKVRAEVRLTSSPLLATFRPKSFQAIKNTVSIEIEEISLELPEPLAVVEEVQTSKSGKMDVTEADIIVSGGRGMRGPENWGILEDLAEAMDAATGCSRPVSDEDWRPHEEHIGQTGRTVSPSLYVACGISGAIQHVAGMSSSKYIVAINKDPEAPIFKIADYGIVGDLFEVLPVMTREVKKLRD